MIKNYEREDRFIGGSIRPSPTGQFLKPQGKYSENDFEQEKSKIHR